jgi:uncharacterized C2H2 Zn-finger protein
MKCPDCDKPFRTESALARHLEEEHAYRPHQVGREIARQNEAEKRKAVQ